MFVGIYYIILKEAMNQETGLLIPYNACVELQDDFNFRKKHNPPSGSGVNRTLKQHGTGRR